MALLSPEVAGLLGQQAAAQAQRSRLQAQGLTDFFQPIADDPVSAVKGALLTDPLMLADLAGAASAGRVKRESTGYGALLGEPPIEVQGLPAGDIAREYLGTDNPAGMMGEFNPFSIFSGLKGLLTAGKAIGPALKGVVFSPAWFFNTKVPIKMTEKTKTWRDNPGGRWLQHHREDADAKVPLRWSQSRPGEPIEGLTEAIPGQPTRKSGGTAVTAGIRDAEIDPKYLAKLPGHNNEHVVAGGLREGRKMTHYRYTPEGKDVNWRGLSDEEYEASGKLLTQSLKERGLEEPIDLTVNYRGEAFISEGNNRARAAADLNWKTVPVNIRYMSGGEHADGPFNLAKLQGKKQTPVPDNWTEYPSYYDPKLSSQERRGLLAAERRPERRELKHEGIGSERPWRVSGPREVTYPFGGEGGIADVAHETKWLGEKIADRDDKRMMEWYKKYEKSQQ